MDLDYSVFVYKPVFRMCMCVCVGGYIAVYHKETVNSYHHSLSLSLSLSLLTHPELPPILIPHNPAPTRYELEQCTSSNTHLPYQEQPGAWAMSIGIPGM